MTHSRAGVAVVNGGQVIVLTDDLDVGAVTRAGIAQIFRAQVKIDAGRHVAAAVFFVGRVALVHGAEIAVVAVPLVSDAFFFDAGVVVRAEVAVIARGAFFSGKDVALPGTGVASRLLALVQVIGKTDHFAIGGLLAEPFEALHQSVAEVVVDGEALLVRGAKTDIGAAGDALTCNALVTGSAEIAVVAL